MSAWVGIVARNLSEKDHPAWGVAKVFGIACIIFGLNFADAQTWTLDDEGLWSSLTTLGVGGVVWKSLFR